MERIQSKRESNKEKKKTAFISAAEKLFIQRGFEGTSIDDVAQEAGLTKRTLYQYFTSKEDLFYAVTLKGGRQLTADYEEALTKGRNALDKIRYANKAYFQFYRDHLGMFQLLNYRPSSQQNNEVSPYYREMRILDGIRMKHYVNIVNEGKADGSINPNLDTKKAVYFAFFSAFSLMYSVSSMDKSMWDMLELDENEFLGFSIDLLTNALN